MTVTVVCNLESGRICVDQVGEPGAASSAPCQHRLRAVGTFRQNHHCALRDAQSLVGRKLRTSPSCVVSFRSREPLRRSKAALTEFGVSRIYARPHCTCAGEEWAWAKPGSRCMLPRRLRSALGAQVQEGHIPTPYSQQRSSIEMCNELSRIVSETVTQ